METVDSEITALQESNPMLGFRGCRLSIKYPEITRMQVRRAEETSVQGAVGRLQSRTREKQRLMNGRGSVVCR